MVACIAATVHSSCILSCHLAFLVHTQLVPPQVFGLGFTSVFEQVLEGLPEADKEAIFAAYIESLDEDPARYKKVPLCLLNSIILETARERD